MTPTMFHQSAFLKNMMVVKKLKLFGIEFSKRYEKKWKDLYAKDNKNMKTLLFVEHNHYHLLLQNKMYYGVGLKLLIIQLKNIKKN